MDCYKGANRRYCQAKLDGHWLMVQKLDGVVECWTRRPTLLDLRWVPSLANAWSRLPDGTTLMGELWYPGKPASHVKTAIKDQDKALQFSAFAVSTMPEGEGLEAVEGVLTMWGFHTIPYWTPRPTPELNYAAALELQPSSEGVVYKDGNLLNHEKWKPVLTTDLVVHGYKDGNGKYLGLLGSLECGLADGTVVASVSGMTDEERVAFTVDPPIGEVVEVEYQYVGSRGRLRHPRFVRLRDDKAAEDCTTI